jgi:hypothetical protein
MASKDVMPRNREADTKLLAEVTALEKQLKLETSAHDMQVWLSYLYKMREYKLSGLMWGKFAKFMENRGLDILDPSFEELPR